MRIVIQRVLNASVTVENEVISSIGQGYLVLVGISKNDTEADKTYVHNKILRARLFADDDDTPWKKNIVEKDLDILCVSQFTLYGNLLKGNKPDFHKAMSPQAAKQMYAKFVHDLGDSYDHAKVHDGAFGAYMKVALTSDGPFTIVVDSDEKRKSAPKSASPPQREQEAASGP